MEEQWRNVKQSEIYQVSNLGRARSLGHKDSLGRTHKGKILKNTVTKQGYVQVGISARTYMVGSLVLTTFVGDRPPGHLVKYKDGNLQNLHLDNILWSKEITQKPEPNTTCKALGCTNNPRSSSADYCEMHYYRLRRNGTLDIVSPRVKDAICWAEGCERKAQRTDGLCRNCHLRYERNGSFAHHRKGELHSSWLDDDEVTYAAIHLRLRHRRGSAGNYKCVDCGSTANHWSYDHNDPGEKSELIKTYEVLFSSNLDCYSPRCVQCHKRYDMQIIRGRRGA